MLRQWTPHLTHLCPISAHFAPSLLICMLSDCTEGVYGAAKGGQEKEEEEEDGVVEGWRRGDRPFQCQFTEIPAVKEKKEKRKVRVLPIFFPDLLA